MTADEMTPTGPGAGENAPLPDPAALRLPADLIGDDRRDAVRAIVDAFVDEAPQRLAELRAGSEGKDAVRVGRVAHALKSDALTFGATRLGQLCLELEAVALGALPVGTR
jgi:HPt (histidine-containing phosphotransfer) domain-containing protein